MFRSLLFIPGNNPSMLLNADIFMADAIIFDLEDAVSITEKINARNLVENYLLTSSVLPKQIVLRINSIDSPWFIDDMNLLKTGKINYLLIPKVDKEVIKEAIDKLSEFERLENLEETKIIALVETAKGIVELDYIAQNNRVIGVLLGAEDLTNDLEIKRTKTSEEIFYARSKVIYSCAANKMIAIDTPYTDINDNLGLEKDSLYSNSLGMKARAAIHPNQLEIINRVYSPSDEEIKWAQEIIQLHEKNKHLGAFQYKGKMIDKPIIDKAYKILEKSKKFNLL
ncbi:MAG: CoA ester lyase [Candidatus Izemoplasmatales bacterium]|jgi:citrate lyase subunit beta/citryl-CoA lyase|nr:CoA ester lyase [Candidatus Izemoplasmatales bacterium]